MKIGVFTIVSKNYIAYARTLMASLKKYHPEYDRYLCLADEVNQSFDVSEEIFDLVQADQLGIDTFQDMTIRYDIMEFNTAVKPFMIEWLFANTDLDAVIYLDPDIQVFSRFDRLESELLNGASMVLTPHITQPVEDGLNPNDHHMLQSGVFNLGFIAVRRTDEAISFVRWWGRRLKTHCASDISKNLFTDQRWCDLAPCFLENLKILKNPGYNVAYWNLIQRSVELSDEGCWLVNGYPLVFFHFSGISVDQRTAVSKHQNRFKSSDIFVYKNLFERYIDALLDAGWAVCNKLPYAYSSLNEKIVLSSIIRRFYREKQPLPMNTSKSVDVVDFLLDLCNKRTEEVPLHSSIVITDLMYFIYRLRPDLQNAFSLATENGQKSFANWVEISGPREYGLPKSVIDQGLIGASPTKKTIKKKYCT